MNDKNTPITGVAMIYSLSGYITYLIGKNLFFKIGRVSYELFEDESYQYVIEPYYEVLEAFEDLYIPGIDIELKQNKYYRVNMIPIFISDRTFPKSRVEARSLLNQKNINYYNPLLWLIDSDYRYTGDNLLVKSENFFNNIKKIENSKNIYRHILYVLQNLGNRNTFKLRKLEVNEKNRKEILQIYLYQYSLVEKSYYKQISKSAGRHKIEVPTLLMKEIVSLYENKIITIQEAMSRLNINSESTFYRRLKEYREKT